MTLKPDDRQDGGYEKDSMPLLVKRVQLPATLRNLFSRSAHRGAERTRRAGLTGMTSLLSQGLAIAISLVSVPLTLHYLGPERYGVWLTISSIFAWLMIMDFGFAGNALVNILSEAEGKDDRAAAQKCVATAFWSLLGIACLLAIALVVIFYFVPPRTMFRVSSAVSISELNRAVVISVASFALMLPLSIINAIYRGRQEGFLADLWLIAANLAALIALIAVCQHKGGLPALVVAVSSARVTMGVASGIYLFGFHHRWLRPRPSAIGMETFRRLADLGGKYVITQLSGLAVTQSAPIIITQLLGPSQVFVFVVASRLLQLPFTVSYLATAPLVSAYGEAQSRGDWDWLWNTWQRSFNIAAFGGGLLIVLLAITAQKVILLWAGPLAVPSPPLIFWLSVYGFFGVVISPVSNLLLGVQRVAAQARINSVTAVANIAFAVFFGRIYGLPGVAMAMALSLVVINGIGQYREVWEFRATAARAEPVLDI